MQRYKEKVSVIDQSSYGSRRRLYHPICQWNVVERNISYNHS